MCGWGEGLVANCHIWAYQSNMEKDGQKLRSCSLLGVLNALRAFSYPGERAILGPSSPDFVASLENKFGRTFSWICTASF